MDLASFFRVLIESISSEAGVVSVAFLATTLLCFWLYTRSDKERKALQHRMYETLEKQIEANVKQIHTNERVADVVKELHRTIMESTTAGPQNQE